MVLRLAPCADHSMSGTVEGAKEGSVAEVRRYYGNARLQGADREYLLRLRLSSMERTLADMR